MQLEVKFLYVNKILSDRVYVLIFCQALYLYTFLFIDFGSWLKVRRGLVCLFFTKQNKI